MQTLLKYCGYVLLIGLSISISCQKEFSCENCNATNKPPVSNAGRDTTIVLPNELVQLDGSASTDPDGTITSYKWAKIAGPVLANFTMPDSSKTTVKDLAAGVYQFELTVTDNGGLPAKDTVRVMINAPGNQPPVACAGPDQIIASPAFPVNLDGRCSADPDNNISTYTWKKIAGPSANIGDANVARTPVTGLLQGVYRFELKVTDAGGLFSKDTIQVTVNATVAYNCGDTNRPIINTQLIAVGTLSQGRSLVSVASAGNKLFFAGGLSPSGDNSSRVDIYDLTTQAWTTAELSQRRYLISAIGAGNKMIFAGGDISDGNCPTNTVDIYDVATNQWSVSFLSIAGYGMASAVVGNNVLFSGGNGLFCGSPGRASQVDIYNLTTGSWSTALLSDTRIWHAAVTVNNKVYFSGGATFAGSNGGGSLASNTIDIYDDATNAWSTGLLTEGKAYHAGVAVNDKIFWAGGSTGAAPNIIGSCSVEVVNPNTGSVSIQQLSRPGSGTGVVKNNQVVFFPGDDKFDVYDVATDMWSIGVLPVGFTGGPVISVNNNIYVVSGVQVFKLEF